MVMTTIAATPHVMNDLLALSHVPRWSIIRHSGQQSVSDHSFRVTVIFMELCLRLGRPDMSCLGVIWAIVHDGPEAWVGDIPKPFKTRDAESSVTPWWHDFKRRIPADVQALVKLSDLIEGATWISGRGLGHHAAHAAVKLKREALEKAREVAGQVDCGPDQLEEIVNILIADIECETGRCGPTEQTPAPQ